MSTFTQLCKLSLILNEILNKVYSERSSNRSPQDLIATLDTPDMQLKNWHTALPDHLRFDNETTGAVPPPHVLSLLSLLALYNVLVILLHRPFVSEGHLHTADPSVALSSFTTCTAAAASILHLLQAYDHTFSIRRAPYLISYATYVAATIFVRVAAQREGASRAHSSLRACLDIFQKNEETNWAVRRAHNVIMHLMDRMGVHLDPHPAVPAEAERSIVEQSRNVGDAPCGRPLGVEGAGSQDLLPDIEVSELDIDMIVQSFIRTQPRPAEEQPFYEVEPFLAHPTNQGASTLSMPSSAQESMSYVPFDDMLFGFNGSPQDNVFGDNL